MLAIAKSLDTDGLTPRVHGRVGKAPSHSLTYTDRERIKVFLCQYARDNALPLPGRLPNFRDARVLLLPSDKTKEDIFKIYVKVAEELHHKTISLRSFQRVWVELCPHIVITKPCTDLCQRCQDFANQISKSGTLTEEEKSLLLDSYNNHVQLAKEQRDHYRMQCVNSKQKYSSLAEQFKGSVKGAFHYSWDYAQQVHIPHHAQQVGPEYFRTPRKCNVFGMCSEGSGRQVFYLIDEADMVGKGANSVVSMVHHYLTYHGHGEEDGLFHFDNCSGQNKNNTVLMYALWRVMTGLHKSIQYSMMIAGHTKFEPDWHFGVWTLKWRNSNVETLSEVAETVAHSSKNGHNIPQLTDDAEMPVVFYDWKAYLQQFFKPLKNLTKYHHFSVHSDKPGEVEVQERISGHSISVNLLKNNMHPVSGQLPEAIPSRGLDLIRQWYLYDNIREFCNSDVAKDVVCPKPIQPKPEINLTNKENSRPISTKRKQSLLK
ncbi:uncharacterized protein LOC134274662 isoform X2 [Saccostrea cucullata]|uniref:uncharacterized protein LOC134274662 isoform X2 n=1 Tax=Saccostrea cuccullata TaxID=36930 RepID=UPI002ED472EE